MRRITAHVSPSFVVVMSSAPLLAQYVAPSAPILGPVRDAGTYHIATGTWTHTGEEPAWGQKVLYRNDISTGTYAPAGVAADMTWVDEGRIPSRSGHAGATADRNSIQAIQIGYCSGSSSAQHGDLEVYESYESCTDPAGISPLLSLPLLVPGGGSSLACWIVNIDLKGTSFEFVLQGDADRVFDGWTDLDNFGWSLFLHEQDSGGVNGPIVCGDPNNFPLGDGTYYSNPGSSYGTGLSTRDRYWLVDSSGTIGTGCYWFGGYSNGYPLASFWLKLNGEEYLPNCGGTEYCPATTNGTGMHADLECHGIPSASLGEMELIATHVRNQPGIFFHGFQQTHVFFGNGYLCVTQGIARGSVVVASENTATYVYDLYDAKHDLTPFVGQTRHFQYWFRDLCSGPCWNLSSAISIVIQP